MAPKKIDENTNVKDFLDTFDGELFEWQVIFRGCESFTNFKEHLEGLELKISNNLPRSLSENVLSESRSSLPSQIFQNY